MYALVEIQGKQYKAEEGSLLTVDKLEGDAGRNIEFDTVLMTSGEQGVQVGTPYVSGAKVTATLEDQIKGDKLYVRKYKRRKGYRRKMGHRQQYSVLKVTGVSGA
jgi:large subunit ribosomal protein L21